MTKSVIRKVTCTMAAMHIAKRITAVLTIGCSLVLPLDTAFAQAPDRKSLSAQWVQWALSIPTPVNPMLDTSGGSCMVGQKGDIWFLTGTFFGGTAARTCSVPAGQVLFVPVANQFSFDTPGVCGQVGSLSVAEMRAANATFVDGITSKSVTVDGQPFKHIWRIQSNVFDVALPEDNVFDAICTGVSNVPAGIYSPGVDEGFYAAIGPFQPGHRTIHILAQNPGASFTVDVTYNLNVVPVTLQ